MESRLSLSGVAAHVQRNFMPYGLVAAIIVSIVSPALGCTVHRLKLHKLSAPGIFLISGLMLKLGDVRRALKSPLPLVIGLSAISLVLPWTAYLALKAHSAALNALGSTSPFLLSNDLMSGVAVFLCMPTALSTGVQICTHFGGNPALALLLTVGSNLLSIATIPFFVTAFLTGHLGGLAGAGAGGVTGQTTIQLQLDSMVLFKSLVKSILIPMLFGIGLRTKIKAISNWVDGNRKVLSMLSALALISVPLAELSSSVSKGLVLTFGELLGVATLGIAFPLFFILINFAATRVFLKETSLEIRRTLVIVCSLKTLPSAVMVIQKLQDIVPTLSGVALIPCMMFHIVQTLVISAFASNTFNKQTK